ncbi:hypothetical protein [Methanosarcina sp. UBA411]|jgi:hypothetical protein|uniref:hypothetical protein n=1 Tax=Methanosarcina sp. UBA411 TaxID=1915589 RepID=UPI0025D95C34|nr:hypothetical protein [Methanosarcina sp. UBA411]
MENAFLVVFRASLLETFYVTGYLILVGLILGLLENRANFYTQGAFGRKGILVTSWIGTPIHEFGHLLMCYIFRHKITKFKLFSSKAKDGTLGYVNHSWNSKSLYQNIGNFFIGMGPIFSGTAALVIGMHLLLPDSFARVADYLTLEPSQPDKYIMAKIFALNAGLFQSIFSVENLISLNFWIYFALAIAISSHMALSKEDLKGAGRGLITIFTFILLVNLVALILNANFSGLFANILDLNVYILAFSMISIVFSSIRLVLSVFAYYLV